ncbi:hypothetical protein RRG08_033655 [Elysia crispata]|uniref:CUB domain-containing protein n=1 Tax=Elysia crispata TaxID=231223 RepID=A0AAE1D134_9GAST|nr:hypothetical protein RRG08_033655 [Elysia crispata]
MLSQKTSSDVGKLYNQGREQVHHFELKPSLDCGGTFTDLVGDFASPGWPRNYTHHLNCTWTVRVPDHKVIMFTFLHFDLGKKSTGPCTAARDRLRITEMTSHGEFRFCASPPMMTYISQTNSVSFNFLTNSHSDAQGFKVVYKGDWPCRATLSSDRGEIASPSWPEQYSPGLNCAWTIQAPPHAKVTLKFTTIDLDGQSFGSCSSQRDVINVYDGGTAMDKRLGRFCQHENPPPLLSSRNVMLVTFRSDAHVQRTGFHASFDFVTPSPSPGVLSGLNSAGEITREEGENDRREGGQYRSSEDSLYDDDGGEHDLLTAVVVEPKWETGHSFRGNYTEEFNFGISGGEFVQPKYPHGGNKNKNSGRRRGITTNTYISILWTLLVSLLIITLFLSLLLLMVCRNNRSRQDKRKAVDKYTYNKEESLSLYEKESVQPPKMFEEDAESFRFPVSLHTDRTPTECDTLCYPRPVREFASETDVAFSNPLYQSRRTLPPMRSELTLVSEILSDSGCSSSNNSNGNGSNSACQGSTVLLTSPC